MSIVQSGLSLALSMPFVLAAWIARMRRPPATLGQDDMANAMAETGLADLVGPCPVSASVDLNVILRDAAVAVSSSGQFQLGADPIGTGRRDDYL